jgi:hypothetical protein
MRKMARVMVAGGGLLFVHAIGSVTADGSRTESLDGDHACKIEIITGKSDGVAHYQTVSFVLYDTGMYVAVVPGAIGLTR